MDFFKACKCVENNHDLVMESNAISIQWAQPCNSLYVEPKQMHNGFHLSGTFTSKRHKTDFQFIANLLKRGYLIELVSKESKRIIKNQDESITIDELKNADVYYYIEPKLEVELPSEPIRPPDQMTE